MVNTDPFDQELPCELTGEERALRSRELALKIQELNSIEERKKSANEEFSHRIKDANRDIQRLARALNSGEELRTIPCVNRPDYARGVVEVIRQDNGTPAFTRKLEQDECQAQLQYDGTHGGKKKSKRKEGDSDEFEGSLQ